MFHWKRVLGLLACVVAASGHAQSIPKDLEPWKGWVLEGQESLLCPSFAGGAALSGTTTTMCAYPGRLSLEIGSESGKFSQSWTLYAEAWLQLPGDADHWPTSVTLNGAAVAVVLVGSTPSIHVTAGRYLLQGSFNWPRRPEALQIPPGTGLLALTLDGRPVEQPERNQGAVWLGKQREPDRAPEMNVQVYRLLKDGIPLILETRVELRVSGDVREESLPALLPAGFVPMSLDSALPARIEADGRARVQVRPGNWSLHLVARAAAAAATIKLPAAGGGWPAQEIWSFQPDERLRAAALAGGEDIDAAQANVPADWRAYPAYRVTSGGELRLEERGRGASLDDTNHLRLRRELYMDFSHQGFTAVDAVSGSLRSEWRLDMRAPYHLLRASSGGNTLLVSATGDTALSGVELRNPRLALESQARIGIGNGNGVLPATGWNARFESVAGVLNLPPGHRLLAVLGADEAPQSWLEQWGLMSVFLLLLATALAFRLSGTGTAVLTFLAVCLLHQEEGLLVWWLLSVFIAHALLRAAPAGRLHRVAGALRSVLMVALLVTAVPLLVHEVRISLYPQLADVPGFIDRSPVAAAEVNMPPAQGRRLAERPTVAGYASSSLAKAVPQDLLSGGAVTDAAVENPYGVSAILGARYAPGTVLQTGPGIPQWRYAHYDYAWNGPVDAAQTVHFIIATPWQMALWRIGAALLLVVLLIRLLRGTLQDLQPGRMLPARGAGAVLLLAVAGWASLHPASAHASSTPDPALLEHLKQRLTRPPTCTPHCAGVMSARIEVVSTRLEVTLQSGAFSGVAIPLPSLGERWDWHEISVDGGAIEGVWRDGDGQLWLPVKSGVHVVKLGAPLPPADSFEVLFAEVPRTVAARAEGWTINGLSTGKMLANTVQFLRAHGPGHESAAQGNAQFSPYVRVKRAFVLDLDWSVQTTVARMAPNKGGFTLAIPLIDGERPLSTGVETRDDRSVLASFDSTADAYAWRSALPTTGTLALTANASGAYSEVWSFSVSPVWRVAFAGLPALLPEDLGKQDWSYEYFPRPGETLTLTITRPSPIPGSSFAVDRLDVAYELGQRSTTTRLHLVYRSTRGGVQPIGLPPGATLTSVRVDDQNVPIRSRDQQLPLGVSPGSHQADLEWESPGQPVLRSHLLPVDLNAPSSNVTTSVTLPDSRWILLAGGQGVGPALLYWGELVIFIAVAAVLGRTAASPLRRHEWLLLGLGLSTFSWAALLVFAVAMLALRWRERADLARFSTTRFRLLQAGLVLLSVAALLSVVAAIPYGLLASPDMRIEGIQQSANALRWFNDMAANVPPVPWVISVSIWWYKAAMLLWALWLAFALARWMPMAVRSLVTRGFWRPAAA